MDGISLVFSRVIVLAWDWLIEDARQWGLDGEIEMTPELSNTLAALAAKLGTSVEKLWPVLVSQARAEAIINLSLFLTVAAFLGILSRYFFKRARASEYESTEWAVGAVGLGAVAAILALGGISVNLPQILFPEVAALKTFWH